MRIIIFLILNISYIHAADLGIRGNIFPIEEESFQEMMKRRISQLNLDKHNNIMKEKLFQKYSNPEPRSIIPRATKTREFKFDPTFVNSKEVKDKNGNIISNIGENVNPLDYIDFDRELFFINALDEKQITWLNKKMPDMHKNSRIILVGGSPMKLNHRIKADIYFDQFSHLTKFFKIENVPAIIYQKKDDKHLTIIEIDIG